MHSIGGIFTDYRQTLQERTAAFERLVEEADGAEKERQIIDALLEHAPEGITIAEAPTCTVRKISRYGLPPDRSCK